MATRQQAWSAGAHQRVVQARDGNNRKKYNTFCRKMPSLIQTAGLIQALVFVESRGLPGEQFCDDLAAVYGMKRNELRERAQTADLANYLALSRDVAAVALWFRRFAQIELGDEEDEG